MKYTYDSKMIKAVLDLPHRERPRTIELSAYLCVPRKQFDQIFEATRRGLIGKADQTIISYLEQALRQFGKFLNAKKISSLPIYSDNWQQIIGEWFAWYLSNPASKATLPSRIRGWQTAASWLEMLRADGIISLDIQFPGTRLKGEISGHGSALKPKLMGEIPAKSNQKREPINKSLAGKILWATDDEYLDEIEQLLNQRNDLLTQALDDYWLKLIQDFRTGKNLLRRVDESEFFRRFAANEWLPTDACRRKGKRITSPCEPNSEAWVMRILLEIMNTSSDQECVKLPNIISTGAFQQGFGSHSRSTPLSELGKRSALTEQQFSTMSSLTIYLRFLGTLNAVDIAVACAILMQEHPNLNFNSLIHSKLTNPDGKSYLISTDNSGQQIFSVDKRRARSRKYAYLTKRAQRVIDHVVRATEIPRKILERAQSKQSRYLFVGVSGRPHGKICHCLVTSAQLTKPRQPSLSRFYPALALAGLNKETLNFSKIRATQGILEWFKTGSSLEVSKKLGNTQRTVLGHYLPEPLIHLYNERLVRRFQNVMLVLSVNDEESSLTVSDFDSMTQLQKFLTQILVDYPNGSSPIGDELHKQYAARGTDECSSTLQSNCSNKVVTADLLTVRLSVQSLGLLYAYRSLHKTKGSGLSRSEAETANTLPPEYFLALADLFSAASKNETVGDALSESLELAKLRSIHDQAEQYALEITLKNIKIQQPASWKDL